MSERRDLTRRQLLRMPIAASPDAQPVEKETSFNLLGGHKVWTVMSRNPSGIRGFLRQPEFVPTVAFVEMIRDRETLVGVDGMLPLGCLHVGARRKREFLSYVFARRSSRRKRRESVPDAQTERPSSNPPAVAHSEKASADQEDSSTTDCARCRQ